MKMSLYSCIKFCVIYASYFCSSHSFHIRHRGSLRKIDKSIDTKFQSSFKLHESSFVPEITTIFPLIFLGALPVHATAQEAVQLLYGHQTNIPYSFTWIILLYGAYKMYFGIYRWLASW